METMNTTFTLVGEQKVLTTPGQGEANNPVKTTHSVELNSEWVAILSMVGTGVNAIIRQGFNKLGNEISRDFSYTAPYADKSVAGNFHYYDIQRRLWRLKIVFEQPEAPYPHGLVGKWAGWWRINTTWHGQSLVNWIKSEMVEPVPPHKTEDYDPTFTQLGMVD